MSAEPLRIRYTKTAEEQAADIARADEIDAEVQAINEQIAELEKERSGKSGEASRLRHYVQQAQFIEDPLICEPHGLECCMEPLSVYSAGAMMHLDDGATCYARPLGRRSEFDPDWLAEYRRIKAR